MAAATNTFTVDPLFASAFRDGSAAPAVTAAKRLERDLGATVWLHHDLDAQRAVRTAPHHYD